MIISDEHFSHSEYESVNTELVCQLIDYYDSISYILKKHVHPSLDISTINDDKAID